MRRRSVLSLAIIVAVGAPPLLPVPIVALLRRVTPVLVVRRSISVCCIALPIPAPVPLLLVSLVARDH